MENKYKYIMNISSGAFSECNLCKYNKKMFAIKRSIDYDILDGITCNELREIFSLLILKNHPNIIKLNELYLNSDGMINLVYKYYDYTLSTFISNTNSAYRKDLILHFISQIISAVYYLHSSGIIHGDLKEQNILVNDKNDFKIILIDFGSSYIDIISEKYSIISTYTIRAPEIYKYDRKYCNKIDIWSIGVLIYKFLTNEDILAHKIHKKTSDIDKLRNIYNFVNNIDNLDVPKKIKYLIKQILKIDPKERPDILQLMELFENLFDVEVPKYEPSNKLKNLNITNKDSNLIRLNNYISSRIFNVKLTNLLFGNIIISKLDEISPLDYITIWYLNYQFAHHDAEYMLRDFIPIFNSYYKNIFNLSEVHYNCFDILDSLEFDIF